MINFAEFAPKGTYVGVKFTSECLDILDSIKLGLGLTNPNPREKQHITLCYSRKPIVVIPKNYKVRIYPTRVESWENDSGGYYIVLMFECEFLRARHESFKRQGATYDFPVYKIHATLSYNEPNKIELDLSDIDKEFYVEDEYVQELNLDWVK